MKSVSQLPTADQAELPANIVKEVNEAVATILEQDKEVRGK